MDETRDNQELAATFEALVQAHRAALSRLARRVSRDPEEAEDLLQETLVDAYRGFHRFRPDSQFYSWVARIMTNNELDRARRRRHAVVSLDQAVSEGPETLELPDESTNPERLILREQIAPPYQSALEALQPAQRATVLLCDIEGATYEEAAAAQACPIGTIRSRLHRAHNALRDFLASLDPRAESGDGAANRIQSRRAFLQMGTAAAAGAALTGLSGVDQALAAAAPVRVLVWCEGPAPREVYPAGIAAAIAGALEGERRVEVRTACLEDADQGLGDAALRETDVLIWWADERGGELSAGRVSAITRRVRDEGMGLIVLHGGQENPLLSAVLGAECRWPEAPAGEGAPVSLRVTAPRHPIARGVEAFTIPGTERWEGAYQAPKPDVLVFDGAYGAAERAWQGMVWSVREGRVFYFQPGHAAYPIFQQEEVRQVLRNAVRWCGRS